MSDSAPAGPPSMPGHPPRRSEEVELPVDTVQISPDALQLARDQIAERWNEVEVTFKRAQRPKYLKIADGVGDDFGERSAVMLRGASLLASLFRGYSDKLLRAVESSNPSSSGDDV